MNRGSSGETTGKGESGRDTGLWKDLTCLLLTLKPQSLRGHQGKEGGRVRPSQSLEGLNCWARECALLTPWLEQGGRREPKAGQIWVLETSLGWAGDSWG